MKSELFGSKDNNPSMDNYHQQTQVSVIELP